MDALRSDPAAPTKAPDTDTDTDTDTGTDTEECAHLGTHKKTLDETKFALIRACKTGIATTRCFEFKGAPAAHLRVVKTGKDAGSPRSVIASVHTNKRGGVVREVLSASSVACATHAMHGCSIGWKIEVPRKGGDLPRLNLVATTVLPPIGD
jgi:hypothetical protein